MGRSLWKSPRETEPAVFSSMLQSSKRYRIAGNFRMVQNFAVFADRSAAAKIRTMNFSSASYGLLVGVVSPER